MAQTQQPKNLEEALKVIQQLTKMIEHQNQLIEQMNVALQLQQHRRFSKKNEAMNPDQLSLFEDESAKITVEDPSNDEVKEESVSRHPKRKKNMSVRKNWIAYRKRIANTILRTRLVPTVSSHWKILVAN